ncbi:hypothetical protein H0H92_000124 [Tricholoma furcatifolium]|nr:hypothetical protein H0H92_000124 [Tricholoma furcatifolium]
MSSGYSTLELPDGATLAYEIFGKSHLGSRLPIVMISGMSSVRGDLHRLTEALSETRPGMGDSTLVGVEEITIELLARDLAFLLHFLCWNEIALCGYSMGGVIAQQLLVLPYHPTNPLQLNFQTTHLFLVATRSVVQEGVGIGYKPPPPGTTRTLAERIAGAKRVIEMAFDPKWIEENGPRFNAICESVFKGLSNRPGEVIAKQSLALQKFDFADLLSKLPTDIKVLIIHGKLDKIVPRWCGEDIQKRIHGAVMLECGTRPGQVPSLDFGHNWYEYFDLEVWQNVVNLSIDDVETPTPIH